jgi:hypothetical protein
MHQDFQGETSLRGGIRQALAVRSDITGSHRDIFATIPYLSVFKRLFSEKCIPYRAGSSCFPVKNISGFFAFFACAALLPYVRLPPLKQFTVSTPQTKAATVNAVAARRQRLPGAPAGDSTRR